MLKTRIDKWLWSVRLYKTRTQATTACEKGRVSLNGSIAKPSKNVVCGDKITVKKDKRVIIYIVQKIIDKRVSATLATDCFEDQSPTFDPPNHSKLDSAFYPSRTAFREKGLGRPTKKERRDLDQFTDY